MVSGVASRDALAYVALMGAAPCVAAKTCSRCEMGDYNSSVTRVWPVFDFLLAKDPSGRSWLRRLIQLADRGANADLGELRALDATLARIERPIPAPITHAIGADAARRLGAIRNAFEAEFPPPAPFLRWLIEHPSNLTWPKAGGSETTFGTPSQELRRRLAEGDIAVREQALRELETAGVERSRRQWWAFEGFTSVDCYLETEHLVLLIEGKRTEPIAAATNWYPERNQVVRNLEVARSCAAGRKNFAVLLCTERPTSLPADCWDRSLPHLSAEDRAELKQHYIGCVCWPEIAVALCGGLALPDTVPAAVDFCLRLRSVHRQP